MPIPILEQRKKIKFLLLVLGGIILFTLIIFWAGFFKKPQAPSLLPPKAMTPAGQKINIDWQTLKNPILETLEPFDEIPPWTGAPGRKNPFLPY